MGQNKLRVLSPDKYNSPNMLSPQDEGTKKAYFQVYEDYVIMHMTEKQIAERYGYSVSHVSRILKWVTMQLGEVDPDVQQRVMIDKLKMREQEIEQEIQNTSDIKTKRLLWIEMRQTDTLIAKLQGVLTTAVVDKSDRRSIQIFTGETIQMTRRQGVEKVVEGEVEYGKDETD